MRSKSSPQIPQRKPAPITAKGPQDCKPLSSEDFSSAIIYVARAFLSSAQLPKEFFAGIPLAGSLVHEGAQRTLLAAYAHFKKDPNRTMNFFFRYKALLHLAATADVSKWVVRAEGTDYSTYTSDILDLAARHPLQPNGHFDTESFLEALCAGAQDSEIPDSLPSPVYTQVDHQADRIAA